MLQKGQVVLQGKADEVADSAALAHYLGVSPGGNQGVPDDAAWIRTHPQKATYDGNSDMKKTNHYSCK